MCRIIWIGTISNDMELLGMINLWYVLCIGWILVFWCINSYGNEKEWIGIHGAVKNWDFWYFRSQEPVPMWEEPGSWYKITGERILGFWEPVTPGEEPGSQFKICKINYFSSWEPVLSMGDSGSPYKIPGGVFLKNVGTGFSQGRTGYHCVELQNT